MKCKLVMLLLLCIITKQAYLFSQVNNDSTKNTIKEDYFEKCRKIFGDNRADICWLYVNQVNINAYKEFKKVGIDLKGSSHKFASNTNFEENSLLADIVIIGTVMKIEYDDSHYDPVKKTYIAYYGSTFTIQVNDELFGKDLYPYLPEQIFIKKNGGLRTTYSTEVIHLEIGKKYVFYLVRGPLEDLKDMLHNPTPDDIISSEPIHFTYPSDDVLDNKYIFEEIPYSTLTIKSDKVYDRFEELLPDLNSIKETIRKIETINDRANFYNRDYKIKKRNKFLKIF